MHRREYVIGISGASVGLFSGCSTLGPQEISIDSIRIINLSNESISFEIVVEWDGNVVYEAAEDLDAKDGNTVENYVVEGEEWIDDVGVWEISARVNHGEWTSITSEDGSEDAVGVRGFIEEATEKRVVWAMGY